jgi:hypothetical protein
MVLCGMIVDIQKSFKWHTNGYNRKMTYVQMFQKMATFPYKTAILKCYAYHAPIYY